MWGYRYWHDVHAKFDVDKSFGSVTEWHIHMAEHSDMTS
jgi:hypothetical protein